MYKIEDIITDLIEQVPIKQIAKIRKISRNTVKSYRNKLEKIKSEWNTQDEFNAFYVCQQLRNNRKTEKYSRNFLWLSQNTDTVKTLTQTCNNLVVLYQKLQENGFLGSYSSLVRFATKINSDSERPVFRIETKPGEYAQVDFGSIGTLYDPDTKTQVKAYVFVMVLCYSWDAYYEIVKSQNIETWCNCHVHAFEHFGSVPLIIIPDNLKSAIIKASFLEPVANRSYADLARHYGFQIYPCIPGTPEHKGKVESGVKYVKNNFLPLRTFKDIYDASKQLYEWNETVARVRIHGTTRQKPAELFQHDEKNTMIPLVHERFEIPVWKRLKVYRDIHIQFDNCYYSVPYKYRGNEVWARKTTSQLVIFYENEVIPHHQILVAEKRARITIHQILTGIWSKIKNIA